MTNEHLRPLLDSERDMHLFHRVGELLGRGDILEEVANVLRKGRVTALQKSGCGVRGIVVGDVVRRLVGRTFAHSRAPLPRSSTYWVRMCGTRTSGTERVEPRSNRLVHRRDQCVRPHLQESHVDRTGRS